MKTLKIIATICCFIFINKINAQHNYQIDSLQIKIYTEIDYEDYHTKNIKVTKIFCDYCSENQLKHLKEEGLRRAFIERYNPRYRLKEGTTKFTLFIRVSKEDLLAIKDEKENNNNQN